MRLNSVRYCRLITTVVLLLLGNRASAQNWIKLAQFGGAPQYISTIYFIDDNVGFVGIYGTTSNFLQRTTNGGFTWQSCITPRLGAPALITDIWFRNASEGWLTFHYGNTAQNLWHSTDGGVSWNVVLSYPDVGATAVRQTSHALSVAGTLPGNVADPAMYVSLDNGLSFQTQLQTSPRCGLEFVDDLHGVSAGLYAPFAVTADGGQTWNALASAPINEAFGVYGMPGSATFFVAPEDILNKSIKNVLRSSDYGQSWTSLPLPPKRPTGDIKGVSNPNGVLLFIQTYMYNTVTGVMRSQDMGNTWQPIGGFNNVNDTRIVVQQCGNKILAADSNCALWVTYNGGDGTHFACSVSDSMLITATLCDSARRLHFLRSPHPSDSVYVIEARIVDSLEPVIVSRAFGIDSLPKLNLLLKQHDSMGFIVHWKPRRMSDTAVLATANLRFITYDVKTGVIDTILIPVTLIGEDQLPQFICTSMMRLDGKACIAQDTTISIQNTGCDTLWITGDGFSQSENWRIVDPLGNVPTLPIAILPSAKVSIPLRLFPRSATLDDTLRFTLRYFRHDSTATVILQGAAKARDPFSTVSALHLDSVLMCATTDTLVSMLDSLCGTMSITGISSDSAQWAFFSADRKPIVYPITLADSLGFPLRVEFTPTYLQQTLDTIRITFRYFDSTFIRKIPVRASAKKSSGFDYQHVLDFGAHSICAPFDTTIALQNQTCAKAIINSFTVASAFELLDPLPLTVDTNGFVTLHIRFSPKAAQTYNATGTFSFTEYNLSASDSLQLTGKGAVTPPTLAIEPALSELRFSLTECDKPDTIAFNIANPSCDSLSIQAMRVTGAAQSVISAQIDHALPFSLAGSLKVHVTVLTSSLTPGVYVGNLEFHLNDTDLLIPISVNIARMPRTIVIDTTPIDLGTLKPCETRDIAIPYTNRSCALDSVTGWTLSDWSSGFNVFGTGRYPPYALTGSETDTLHITFDGRHTGTIYDTVLVGFGTDDNRTRRIPVKTYVPSIDSVLFTLRMPGRLASNEGFTIEILPDRIVTGKGLFSISGSIYYSVDDFEYLFSKEGSGLSMPSFVRNDGNNVERLDFVLSNSAGISLDPNIPILSVRLRSLVTDSVSYTVGLDSILLNGSDPNYAHCTLATVGSQVSARYVPACGDSLLITALQHHPLFLASQLSPNPITAETNYRCQIKLQSAATGIFQIQICDAIGRIVKKTAFAAQAGESLDQTIDLHMMAAGSYQYEILYSTDNRLSSTRGNLMLLR